MASTAADTTATDGTVAAPAPSTSRAVTRSSSRPYKSFADFYPFYLSQHRNRVCRRLHVFATTICAILFAYAAKTRNPKAVGGAVVQTYFWAWIGHFVFEKNKPATFTYPVWSFMGDWKMWYETITGQRKW